MSDDDTFVDEQPDIDVESVVDEPEDPGEKRNGHRRGPGFLLGIILGGLAGAAAAALLTPSEDEDLEAGGLARVRARLHDAAAAGREAAQEKEAEMRSRYDELTK